MTFVIRDVVDIYLPVIIAVNLVKVSEYFWEVEDTGVGPWRAVNANDLEDLIMGSTRRRVAVEKGAFIFNRLTHGFQFAALVRFLDVAGKNNNSPFTITRKQLLEMPRSGIGLVKYFDAWHAFANRDSFGQILVRCDS